MSLRKISLIFLLFLTLGTVNPILAISELDLISKNGKNDLYLTINSAYYTDIDNDDVLDILAFFDVATSNENYQMFKLSAVLTLPSGFQFTHSWVITPKRFQPSYRLELHDHAIESGDYELKFIISLHAGGKVVGDVSYTFDPPGGSGGGTPIAYLV